MKKYYIMIDAYNQLANNENIRINLKDFMSQYEAHFIKCTLMRVYVKIFFNEEI